jgi:antitoxin HicB
MRFIVTLETDQAGYIVAECPALPGCLSQGKSRDEALENIKEAIQGYLESLRKHGDPLPTTEVAEVEVLVA